jgi:hypothetical protein
MNEQKTEKPCKGGTGCIALTGLVAGVSTFPGLACWTLSGSALKSLAKRHSGRYRNRTSLSVFAYKPICDSDCDADADSDPDPDERAGE